MISQCVTCPCGHLLVQTQTGFKWLMDVDCMFNYSLDCRQEDQVFMNRGFGCKIVQIAEANSSSLQIEGVDAFL